MIVLIIETNPETLTHLEASLEKDRRYTGILIAKSNTEGLKLLEQRTDISRVCIHSVINGRGDAIAALQAPHRQTTSSR